MFEFLFCPYHGIFKPDNIAFALTYGNALWNEAQYLFLRYWGVVSRWL